MTEEEIKEVELKYLGNINVGLKNYQRLYDKGLKLIQSEPQPKKLLLHILDDYLERLEDMPPIDLSVTNLDKLDKKTKEQVKALILFGTQAALIKENSDTQKNLNEANANYRDLLSVITHEFKNSLTSIYGYNRIIKKHAQSGTVDHIVEISDNIDRLTQNLFGLVETLFSMSLIEEGRLEVDRRIFDIMQDALEPIIAEMEPRLFQKGMKVSVKAEEKKNIYYGDERLFQLVFRNLIMNAIQYGDAHTDIEVEIKREEDNLKITIFNYGSGIEREKLHKIFEKFSRFHNTKEKYNVGIGLYAVKNIILLHQGSIEAESEFGKWMRFIIKLPMNFQI